MREANSSLNIFMHSSSFLAGIVILIGLPALFMIGGWIYHERCKKKEADEVESEQEFVDEI